MFLFTNAKIFDGVNDQLIENGFVLVEGDEIREISGSPIKTEKAETIDCKGHFLMPGLIDNHFHVYSVTFDMQWLDRMPKPLLHSYAIKFLNDTLQRGFTTIRDPAGGEIGLALATQEKLINGPRFYYGGKALTQTGGHGDMRLPHHEEPCNCANSFTFSQIVDGADEVRKAARKELHRGADHIKVFISGGVASPSDPIWMPQFTDEELKAAVEEALTRRKYVTAHCHTDDGARRCLKAGIRSIEHATNVTDETASMIAATGETYTVPTLAVAHQITDYGDKTGMRPESIDKIKGMIDQMLGSIEACRRAGVKIGMGTDLFGVEWHHLQSSEFRFRSEVDSPIDILRSATSINAEIMQRKGELGVIAPGAKADLIVIDGDPTEDITIFEKYQTHMPVIMKGGEFKRNNL